MAHYEAGLKWDGSIPLAVYLFVYILRPFSLLLKPMAVSFESTVSGGNVGSKDAAIETTPYMDVQVSREAGCREQPWMHLSRFPEETEDSNDK
ncbi:MAG: hypothetical protein KZQ89_01965 [Candidatus Thiodiazotropha sp. (ex Lucinoma kastoroae)]|nr:hypothetical protein [Candidatus Thiodiazotropha sp. (ex Lucinoma kastoroae)]